jgi:hypothetical protein
MMEINGYEQHRIMESGFHANGADVYTRFKNLGLAVMWANDLRLYHPWHANTLVNADEYKIQNELIQWRFRNLEYLAINGISPGKNSKRFNEEEFMRNFNAKRDSERQSKTVRGKSFLSRMFGKSN